MTPESPIAVGLTIRLDSTVHRVEQIADGCAYLKPIHKIEVAQNWRKIKWLEKAIASGEAEILPRKPGRPHLSTEGSLVRVQTYVEPSVRDYLISRGGSVYAGAQIVLREAAKA